MEQIIPIFSKLSLPWFVFLSANKSFLQLEELEKEGVKPVP